MTNGIKRSRRAIVRADSRCPAEPACHSVRSYDDWGMFLTSPWGTSEPRGCLDRPENSFFHFSDKQPKRRIAPYALLDGPTGVNNGAVITAEMSSDRLEWCASNLSAQKHCQLPGERNALLARPGLEPVRAQVEVAGDMIADRRKPGCNANPSQCRQYRASNAYQRWRYAGRHFSNPS